MTTLAEEHKRRAFHKYWETVWKRQKIKGETKKIIQERKENNNGHILTFVTDLQYKF